MIKYIVFLIVAVILGILYDKYKLKQENEKNVNEYDLVKKYLLHENSLIGNKPILWIPIEYNINERNWLSFGSRNSYKLNQPYLYLTIQSIVNKCADDFNVCLIDDSSISKLIPGWNINMDGLADPVKSHIRSLAHIKILYQYGGVMVPPSFVCVQSLENIHSSLLEQTCCYVGEFVDRGSSSTLVNTFPNHKFMGCKKNSPVMKDLMLYLEVLESKDATSEMDFLGQINRWCFEAVEKRRMTLVDGKLLGTKNNDNNNVVIDELLGSSYINFSDNIVGIYIPADEVLRRTKYEWFARLSNEQLLNSDVIVAKHILLSNKQ